MSAVQIIRNAAGRLRFRASGTPIHNISESDVESAITEHDMVLMRPSTLDRMAAEFAGRADHASQVIAYAAGMIAGRKRRHGHEG